ncbi:MAG: TlpA disulfide reductase family protein [Maribacter sp.]|uniref:TlpA family protein disulfide reductase n=1 Tax=Maribacter sp. TaxID=1897614 RepID=UPI003297DFEA
MKLKKENLSNFAFIVLLALLLFTPVGFHARVLVSRLFSFSPSELNEEEQFTLSNYNWELSTVNGETFDFKDTKGKVVLVNFWATWCSPCVAEMPSLHELYTDYHDQIEFVMVANDDPEKVKLFFNSKHYDFPTYFERTARPTVLSADHIPTTFIIDRTGKIVVEKTGAANWNSIATRDLLENLIAR